MTLYWSRALPLCRYVDFAFLSCADYSLAQTREIVQQAQASGSRIVCATRGDEGAILFDGQDWYQQAPDYVTPVDTMGAGDAFITAFICHFLAQPTGNKREAITNSLQKSSSFLGTNLPERRGIWLRDSLLTYNAISHFSVLISVR